VDQFDMVKERLREEDYFITEPREAVINYLSKTDSPVTIDEIIDAVESEGINRSSVYRTVNLFEELGVVDKVLFRDGVNRVEMSSDFGGTHHHHLVCRDCEQVIEFEECGIENLQRIADIKHDFEVESHYMEFYGLCNDCRNGSDGEGT
jgi:Fur family ferric uptake transcriptional regulator